METPATAALSSPDTEAARGFLTAPQTWLWLLLPVAILAFLDWRPLHSSDIWWHLAGARLTYETGQIRHDEPFLYSADDHVWINYSWAAQLVFYTIYSHAGATGLVLSRIGLACLGIALFYLAAVQRGAPPWLSSLLSVSAISLITPYILTRPLLWSVIWSGALLLCLHRSGRTGLIGAVVILLAWTHTHITFPLGFVIVLLHAVYGFVQSRFGEEEQRAGCPLATRWSAITAALCAGGLLSVVNPFGLDLHHHVITVIECMKGFRSIMREALPLSVFDPHNLMLMGATVLVAIIALFFSIRQRRVALPELLLMLLFAYKAWDMQRYILYFSCFSIPLLGNLLARETALINRRWLPGIVCTGLAALSLSFALQARGTDWGRLAPWERDRYPMAAAEFLREIGFTGNIACTGRAGGYLSWALPGCRVKADGRGADNDIEVFRAMFKLQQGAPGWQEGIPEPEESDVLLLPIETSAPLQTLNREWACVHYDNQWLLLLRRGDGFTETIARYDRTPLAPYNVRMTIRRARPPELDRIIQILDAQLTRDPKMTPNLIALGIAHRERALRSTISQESPTPESDLTLSAAVLAQARALQPLRPEGYLEFGVTLLLQKRYDEAAQVLIPIYTLAPTYQVRTLLELQGLAQFLNEHDDPAGAEHVIRIRTAILDTIRANPKPLYLDLNRMGTPVPEWLMKELWK